MSEEILDSTTHKIRERQRLAAKQEALMLELSALDGVKGKSTERSNLKKRLETVARDLVEVETIASRTARYDDIVSLMALEAGSMPRTYSGLTEPLSAGIFSTDATMCYFEQPNTQTGKGEISYRVQHSLPTNAVGGKGRDVPEHGNAEIKDIFHVDCRPATKERAWGYEVFDIQKFRAGQTASDLAKDAIYDMIWELVKLGEAEGNVHKYNTQEMKDLINGTLSERERAKLPPTVHNILMAHLRPSVSLADCPFMILTLPEGWLTVPYADYDEAFDVLSVSKGLVSFLLKASYVRARRERFLAAASASAAAPAFIAAQ